MGDLASAVCRRSLTLSLLLWVTAVLADGAETSRGEPGRAVTIRLYDYTEADPRLLVETRQVTSTILAGAGIAIRWEQCRTADLERYRDSSCRQPADASELQLRIQLARRAKQFSRSAAQYGYALLPQSRSGFGVIAGVFVDRIRTLAREEGQDLHIVLGYLIAHEVGHLLLGSNSHAHHGIMLAKWKTTQLQQAQMRILRFTPAQEQLMRRQVRARLLAQYQGPHPIVGAERSGARPLLFSPSRSSHSLPWGHFLSGLPHFSTLQCVDNAPLGRAFPDRTNLVSGGF